MPFQTSGLIRYYTFDLLNQAGAVQAVFSRQGGVSQAPWQSLNVGGTVGDDPQSVAENRRLAFAALNRSLNSLYDVWQVHGRDVVCATAPRPTDQPHLQADAILTDQPGVTLFMRFADCVPILLFDPVRQVVGLVHAGWQGTVKRVAGAAIQQMGAVYGSQAGDVLAAIGPSIGPHHYDVGPEVASQVEAVFGNQAHQVLHMGEHAELGDEADRDQNASRKVTFDLWNANRLVLEHAGVRRVEISGICTACNQADWYSHRAEHGHTGRFGALIALHP